MPGSRLTVSGNKWFSGPFDPGPTYGAVDSYFINTLTFVPWYKDAISGWVPFSSSASGYQVNVAAALNNGDQITLTSAPLQLWLVQGNGASVTLNALPFSAPPANGTSIRLVGASNSMSVIVPDNSGAVNGCILNGDKELGAGSAIEVEYIAAVSRFVMTSEALKTL